MKHLMFYSKRCVALMVKVLKVLKVFKKRKKKIISKMKRFIEIDSTYRNRLLYPNPADFVIPYGTNINSNNAPSAIDPVTNEGIVFPSEEIAPLAFYQEYLNSITVPTSTVMWRGYAPFMFQLQNGQIYVDELPLAPTSSTNLTIIGNATRNVYPHQESVNYYNNHTLENVNNGDMEIIDSSVFTSATVSLQTFIVERYFTDIDGFHITVFFFNPNSYPPSNIDRFYQGKYIKHNNTTALILNYFINHLGQYQFDIDTNLVLSKGDSIEIITNKQTILNTTLDISSVYPAFRYPLPDTMTTGGKAMNIAHAIDDIIHIRAVRHADQTFGIAFLVDDGTSSGVPIGKLFYIASTDIEGISFPNAETQVNMNGLTPIQNTNMGLSLYSDDLPRIVINTFDGSDYYTYYLLSDDTVGTTWTTDVLSIDGPFSQVPAQTMDMQYLNDTASSTIWLSFVETNSIASGSSLIVYDGNPPTNATDLSFLFPGPPYDTIVKDMFYFTNLDASNYIGILFTIDDVLHVVNYGVGDTPVSYTSVSSRLVQGTMSGCEIVVPTGANYTQGCAVYITKNSNDVYFQYQQGWETNLSDDLLATDASSTKLCKVVSYMGFPVVIYKALDGIRMIQSTAFNDDQFIWNSSVLLSSITSTTTIDVIEGVSRYPYIVFNGPVSSLNVLSLGLYPVEAGVMYRIRSGSPLQYNSYMYTGGPNNVSLYDILSTSYANNYLQVRTRQFIDTQQSFISSSADDALYGPGYGIDIAIVNEYPSIVFTNYPTGEDVQLFVAQNTQTNGGGTWTINQHGPFIIGESYTNGQYSICEVDGYPSVAYVNNQRIIFGQPQYKDASGLFSQTSISIIDKPYTYLTLMTVLDNPVIVYIKIGDIINYAYRSIGTWNNTSLAISALGVVSKVINHYPVMVYFDASKLVYAINDQANGLGSWSTTSIYTGSPGVSTIPSLGITTLVSRTKTEIPYIIYETSAHGTIGITFTNNSWVTESTPGLPRTKISTLYNQPILFYPTTNYYQTARRNSNATWTTQNISYQVASAYNYTVAITTTINDVPVLAYNSIVPRCTIDYNEEIITTPRQLNNIRLIRQQLGSYLETTTNFSYNIYDTLYLSQVSWEILSFAYDNYNPLQYNGSILSLQQEVCYEVELQRLTLPNKILLTGYGNRIAFYPYIYVVFEEYSQYNQIISNNPNSVQALFSIGIYNVNNPDIASFVVLDGRGMVQTIKFKPNTFFKFKIILPNGDIFQVESDTIPPILPDPNVQISAVFSFKRLS